MRLRRSICLVALAVTAVLAFGATTAGAGSSVSGSPAPSSTPVAKVGIRYTVTKFVRRGHRLVAYGTAMTSRRAFRASVAVSSRRLAAQSTICPVLELTIQQLDVNLLGALIHLD